MTITKVKEAITKIIHTLLQFFYLALAMLLISLLFFLRFLPKSTRNLFESLTALQYLALIFTIILVAINIYTTMKITGLINKENTESKILQNIKMRLHKYSEIFLDLFRNLYDFCWYILEYLSVKFFNYECLRYHVVRELVKSFNNNKHFPYYFFVLIAIRILPRLIFVVIFTGEAFFYKQLDLTFRCIPLLLISLLETMFIFVIKDFYDIYFKSIFSFVLDQKNNDTVCYSYNPAFKDQYPYGTKDEADFMFNHFENWRQTLETLNKYEKWKNYKQLSNLLLLGLQYTRLLTYVYMLFCAIIST